MKVFTKSEVYKTEKIYKQNFNVSEIALMRRAAEKISTEISRDYGRSSHYYLLCGQGNNSGDGFAVAILLQEKGYKVSVLIDFAQQKYSEAASYFLEKLKTNDFIKTFNFNDVENLVIEQNDLLVDALLGIGVNRVIKGKCAKLLEKVNEIKCQKVSVDIPSGLYVDEITPTNQMVFKADKTYGIQFWKKAYLLPENGEFLGKVEILDIGILTEQNNSKEFINDEVIIRTIYKKRRAFSHKGTYGKSILVGGSYGKMGAAVMCVKAALRAGSGLTECLAPKCGYEILQKTVPEAMFISGGENCIEFIANDEKARFGIGPGLGTEEITKQALLKFLKKQHQPLVLDADALNILSENNEHLKLIPKNSIITPHPKEFERLFGKTKNFFEQSVLAKEKAKTYQIIIILKAHRTQIVMPSGEIYYNITGNSGMAKGGSGDALTGIVTALLAQNYNEKEAALFGVWLHGKAGDFAANKWSKEAMITSDLIDGVADVFKYLNG